MKEIGQWILLTFAIYYVLALITKSNRVVGCLILGAVLALGIVLAF